MKLNICIFNRHLSAFHVLKNDTLGTTQWSKGKTFEFYKAWFGMPSFHVVLFLMKLLTLCFKAITTIEPSILVQQHTFIQQLCIMYKVPSKSVLDLNSKICFVFLWTGSSSLCFRTSKIWKRDKEIFSFTKFITEVYYNM